MTISYGRRLLKGCMPPLEDPTRYHLYWRMLGETSMLLFARVWIKSLNIWAPSDCVVRVISGGTRIPVHSEDNGKDGYHKLVIYVNRDDEDDEDNQLIVGIEAGDHRSIQTWTHDQLSNYKGEETEINVE